MINLARNWSSFLVLGLRYQTILWVKRAIGCEKLRKSEKVRESQRK